MSPRFDRQPVGMTDHATMLSLAVEDLQRAATLGRNLARRHPERARAALDLLLLTVGCWEVRWLGVAHAASGRARSGSRIALNPPTPTPNTATVREATAMADRGRSVVTALRGGAVSDDAIGDGEGVNARRDREISEIVTWIDPAQRRDAAGL